MATAENRPSDVASSKPAERWQDILARMPGATFPEGPAGNFLNLRDTAEVLLAAGGVELPAYPRRYSWRVAPENSGARGLQLLGALELADAKAPLWEVVNSAPVEACVRFVIGLWKSYEQLRPQYDPAHGHPLRWQRKSGPPPGQPRTRLIEFPRGLWDELGADRLWRALDLDVVREGSFDVELFFPRVNVESFARALCPESQPALDPAPAEPKVGAREKWATDLESIVLAAGGMKIAPALDALLKSSDEYALDGDRDLVVGAPNGRRTIPRGTVANELSRIRKKLKKLTMSNRENP